MMNKIIDKNIFRAYDVRGIYPDQIDSDVAYLMGLAFGTKIRSLGKKRCVVGHDNRLSSDELTSALLKGITHTGVNVEYLGLCTTPMYYFACLHLKIDTGIMVTASHNPKNENGFKIAIRNYDNAVDDEITEIYDIINRGKFARGIATVHEYDIKNAYVEAVLKDLHFDRRLRVVVDPANASATCVIHDIFDKINAEIIYINEKSDGSFPNHHPDPSIKENMIMLEEAVKKNHADLGIGLDGDADRVGIVDDAGNFVAADTFMAVIWGSLMPKITDKRAIFDVKCSKQLEDEIIRLGGIPIIYKTGNSYLKRKCKEEHLEFGGELSGHLFFNNRWYGFDDGIYSGLRILEILANGSKKFSELTAHLNRYYSTLEIKIPVPDEEKDRYVDKVGKYCKEKGIKAITIDGVRAQYEDGWALVRKSNTGPNLTLRFEAQTEERLKELQKIYMDILAVEKE